MKTIKVTTPLLIVITILLLLTACGGDDNPTNPEPEPEPTTGAVEVTTSTSGPDKDEDGYTVSVDGSNSQSADTSDAVVIANLEEGSHDLELSGTASNCSVDGDNPQSVSVTAGDTTSASFDISCIEVIDNQIIFYSDRDVASGELYLTNPDGTNQTRLTNNSATELFPAISPDGTKIVYVQGDNIWVMNADGTGSEQLTTTGTDVLPRWSPDGSQIVFTSERDGDGEIYIMDANGDNQTNLTNSPGSYDEAATWSPDGEKIIFDSDRDSDGDYEIYSINTEGTALQKLTDNTAGDYLGALSPDGSKIAFMSNRDGDREVFVMNADGTDVQKLTDNSVLDGFHTWSPDGSQLIFQSQRDGNSEIYKINIDGTGATNLTVNGAGDAFPFWSPVE